MRAGILNAGKGSWAFSELAEQLAAALWVDVVTSPADFNYVLFEEPGAETAHASFIPRHGVDVAADKRTQTQMFAAALVPMPETVLLESPEDVARFVARRRDRRWVLKYPIGCGAAGHRIVTADMVMRDDWPRPFIVQAFIEMDDPAVYRIYGAGGELFGWNVRRFGSSSSRRSPFVAHATGASYELKGQPPARAADVARQALTAAGLSESFGCVDLLRSGPDWLVIEVGTDGFYNYVDREVPEPLATELDRQIAIAVWAWIGEPHPWGATWHRRWTSPPTS
jgi:glutathione synthase/RimK-type ligase-like ATP-grasp enzyme